MKKVMTLLVGIALFVGTTTAAWAGTGTHRARHDVTHAVVGGESGALVVAWNRALLNIVLTPGAQPATIHPTRSFAMLQAAIYDSVVSITHDAPPYRFAVDASDDARPDAAAATAGHDTLVALYPKMKTALDQQLATELVSIPDGTTKQAGVQVGQRIAQLVLTARANDGSAMTPPPARPANDPGDFRPTPPTFAAAVFTGWSRVTPFVLRDEDQFRPGPPPPLASAAYANAVNEVKSLGQNTSTTRTADETTQAKFWAPPIWNTWNEIADQQAALHHTDLVQTARLFVNLDLAFADGVIGFYDAKYQYDLWRPISAIREAGTDNNLATVADPNWTPLAATPADPSYPGAHSTISEAGATVLSSFFGNKDQIAVSSDMLPGVVRHFDSYQAVATEAGLSRIFAGVHTRVDHEAGVELGRHVAQFVLERLEAEK